jgi:hypothetical protein
MPIMPIGLSIDPIRPSRTSRGIATQRDRLEGAEGKRQSFGYSSRQATYSEADLIFEADARRLGYLNRPRGIARYYRDHGMLPPRYVAEQIPKFESTNFDINGLASETRH